MRRPPTALTPSRHADSEFDLCISYSPPKRGGDARGRPWSRFGVLAPRVWRFGMILDDVIVRPVALRPDPVLAAPRRSYAFECPMRRLASKGLDGRRSLWNLNSNLKLQSTNASAWIRARAALEEGGLHGLKDDHGERGSSLLVVVDVGLDCHGRVRGLGGKQEGGKD
ncbi:hypothetical protein HMN09_01067300 [Mycena chlorophos]|uniref:Uncharacterized protein n=1 Tax=Mycena chlorophos TaxID=658473 RepID=A0A8H6VWN1_MYCCL|nr:hypothetical protein HMN09_01067300 [Mycena chlorophos]